MASWRFSMYPGSGHEPAAEVHGPDYETAKARAYAQGGYGEGLQLTGMASTTDANKQQKTAAGADGLEGITAFLTQPIGNTQIPLWAGLVGGWLALSMLGGGRRR